MLEAGSLILDAGYFVAGCRNLFAHSRVWVVGPGLGYSFMVKLMVAESCAQGIEKSGIFRLFRVPGNDLDRLK